MSTTAVICRRCGSCMFPHLCLPIAGLSPIIADEQQLRVTYEVTWALDMELAQAGDSQCVCAETSIRNCPVHGQGDSKEGVSS